MGVNVGIWDGAALGTRLGARDGVVAETSRTTNTIHTINTRKIRFVILQHSQMIKVNAPTANFCAMPSNT